KIVSKGWQHLAHQPLFAANCRIPLSSVLPVWHIPLRHTGPVDKHAFRSFSHSFPAYSGKTALYRQNSTSLSFALSTPTPLTHTPNNFGSRQYLICSGPLYLNRCGASIVHLSSVNIFVWKSLVLPITNVFQQKMNFASKFR